LSASISFANPNTFSFEYFFGSSTVPSGDNNVIVSAFVDYKVTVVNDFAGDYTDLGGTFVIDNTNPF
jgi:hypothetical protein